MQIEMQTLPRLLYIGKIMNDFLRFFDRIVYYTESLGPENKCSSGLNRTPSCSVSALNSENTSR